MMAQEAHNRQRILKLCPCQLHPKKDKPSKSWS